MAALIEEMAQTDVNTFEQGMTTRRGILGDAHVDHAEAAKTDVDLPVRTLITEGAWSSVWSDPTILHRKRSMLMPALSAATGNFDEIPACSRH